MFSTDDASLRECFLNNVNKIRDEINKLKRKIDNLKSEINNLRKNKITSSILYLKRYTRCRKALRKLLNNKDLPKQWWPTARCLLATSVAVGDLISFYEMWKDFLRIWRRYGMHLNPAKSHKFYKVLAITLLERFKALINSRPAIALVA